MKVRASVATVKTIDDAAGILNEFYNRADIHIHWADSNAIADDKIQVTVVYEFQADVQARLEQEWQQECAKAEAQMESEAKAKKQRKQPTRKQLQAKAEKLFLYMVEITRNNDNWEIRNQYGQNEVIYQCKTATGISRKLTAMYWEQMTKNLRSLEPLAY